MIKEKIYEYTGDPFVDAGAWALAMLNDKDNPDEITKTDFESKLDFLADLYTKENWRRLMYSVFPNNKIINPSIKKENEKESYLDLLQEFFNNVSHLKGNGLCLACGKRDIKNLKTKDIIPLIGSKKLINFFPSGQKGAMYCDTCSLLVQFSPLLLYKARQLVLIQSSSSHVLRYWAMKIKSYINEQIGLGDFEGCWDSGITQPINSLFDFASNLILEYDLQWLEEASTITIYHFTNYNQGPDVEIFHLPTKVFRFLAYIHQHKARNAWYNIVKKGFYRIKPDSKENEIKTAFKKYTNNVYINLLENRSIIRYFIDTKNHKCEGDWDLLSFYLKEVRSMKIKRIDVIKKLGDQISDYIKQTNNFKRLKQLEYAKNYNSFRNILRLIGKDRLSLNPEDPLITLDDYINYLFPEGALSWNETRDLILFRIYEMLHDYLKKNLNVIKEEFEELEENEEKRLEV